jgi:hypothetical protein
MNCWRGIRNGELILKVDTMIHNIDQINLTKFLANFQVNMLKNLMKKDSEL